MESDSSYIEFTESSPVAFAYPIGEIQIDGSLDDWPEKINRYPLKNISSTKPKNAAELSAHFKVGYNMSEQSLYLAVVLEDETSSSKVHTNSERTKRDLYQLYLDERHLKSGSSATVVNITKQGAQCINHTGSWDPNLVHYNSSSLKTVVNREGSMLVYESKIRLKTTVYQPKSIGIDHIVFDFDTNDTGENYSKIMWGKLSGKEQTPGRLGTLIMLESSQRLGVLQGSLTWNDQSELQFPENVRVTSLMDNSFWLDLPVDSLGRYSTELPSGEYSVSVSNSLIQDKDFVHKIDIENSQVTCTVKENKKVLAPPLTLSTLPPPNLILESGILHSFEEKEQMLLDQFVSQYQSYYEIPGVSLALIKDGEVVYHKAYGVKNSYTGESINENTLYEAASLTKPVFAFAVCRLAERGVINLDKPLYQYLPFQDIEHDERYKLISARHVLSHQTGFPNWPIRNEKGHFDFKFTPGTAYGYSGEAFEYLKRVVVHLTNKNISEILDEEVLTPLGMEASRFRKSKELYENASHGHINGLPTRLEIYEDPSMAGGMFTHERDFAKFMLSLSKRKALYMETYKEFFGAQTILPIEAETDTKEYFGLGIYHEKSNNGWAFGHNGNNGDFQCQFMMYEDLDIGFVVFTNSNTGGQLAYEAIERFLISGRNLD